MSPNQLLVTKCLIPIVSQPLVQRDRLTHSLERGLQRKLTLVSAPAGFGKTTLLAAWASSQNLGDQRTDKVQNPQPAPLIAWVSLDASDNIPEQFWQYVFTALERAIPGSATEVLKLLQAPLQVSLESVLTSFINLRLELPTSSLLILDDYHLISDETIHASIAFLLEHLPPKMHVLLLSRTEPPLPLARLRANRQVHEIGVEDLRCTLAEADTFLREVMGVQLTDDLMTQMTARTEGWLVGLQLLGLSLQGRRDPKAVLEELRGSQRYVLDYLMDEVLRQQPEVMQRFLLQTSILERLSASLCNAVLGRSDSQAMLEMLERANLFVVMLDDRRQWFRYHHLFREALQTRLDLLEPDLAHGLHLRASQWFAAHGDSFAMAFHVIQSEAGSEALNLSDVERRKQTGYVAAARAQMAGMQGDVVRAREFARVALTLLPSESLIERSAATAAESTAALASGDIQLAYQTILQAAALMQKAGHPMAALSQTAVAGLYLHMQGRLTDAESLLDQTLAQVVQPGDPPVVTACLIYVFQAFLLLERNRLDAALKLVMQAIHLAEQVGFDAASELGYTILSSIHLARNEHEQSQTSIDRAIRMPLQHDNPFQQAMAVTPIQVRLWLAKNELEQAQDWVRQLESSPPLALFPQERLEVSRSRVLLTLGQVDLALEILDNLLPAASESGRWDHVLEMWLLQVVSHHFAGDENAALEVLERCVILGESRGFIRRFLDEGLIIASMLLRLREQQPESISIAYLEMLLAAFGTGAVPAKIVVRAQPKTAKTHLLHFSPTQLSGREKEVLELLARGLANDDIARRLEVSKYTVKSHVSSLLSKLEAKNRTHAVSQARNLGLLERDS
jgi:LuxR family transcriptional regulator, maltose regulon positive regulatory protein